MNTWRNESMPGGNRSMMPIRGGVSGRVAFGLVVLTLGVLWTLDNLGLIDSHRIVEWWPAILVAVGLSKLFGFGTRPHPVVGTVFTLVGTVLLLDSIDVIETGSLIVPVVLIVVGASLVFRRKRPDGVASPGSGADRPADPSAVVDSFAMWGGSVHKSVSPAFRGGDATAVMGGVELDLRPATLAPEGAVVEVFTWWGGIDIKVAPNTRVVNQATAFMGGIDDKSHPGDGSGGTLVLKGLVVMGGVEIKN